MKISQQSKAWVTSNKDTLSASYCFYGTTVEVKADDRRLIDALNNIYYHFISDKQEPRLVVEAYSGDAHFLAHFDGNSNITPFASWPRATQLSDGDGKGTTYNIQAGPDFFDLLQNIYYTILAFALINLNQFLQIHAGAVTKGQIGILLPGGSGSGKSTLTFALTRAGYSFLADEVCLIDPHGPTMFSFPRNIFMGQRSLDHFSELKVGHYLGDIANVRGKKCIGINEDSVHAIDVPSRISFIIFPTYCPGERVQLKEIPSAVAVAKLLSAGSVLNMTHPGVDQAEVIDSVSAFVTNVACFELTSSSIDDALSVIDDLVKNRNPL